MKIDGQVDREGAHEQRRRGLVAAAHQHRAVDRIAAQRLLGLDRKEVAVHHGRGLLKRLRERQDRHLDGKAARVPDAAPNGLGALAEMAVTTREVAPGVDDRDHRPARELVELVAELFHPRAMAEAAQGVGPEPAPAPQVLGGAARQTPCREAVVARELGVDGERDAARREAAVDGERLAGHEGRLAGEQERRHVRDLARLRDASQGVGVVHLALGLGGIGGLAHELLEVRRAHAPGAIALARMPKRAVASPRCDG